MRGFIRSVIAWYNSVNLDTRTYSVVAVADGRKVTHDGYFRDGAIYLARALSERGFTAYVCG